MLLLLLALVSRVHAWGAVGHQLTGAVADRLISASTRDQISAIIPKEQRLEHVAAWADHIRSDHRYDWSHPLHYADASVNKETLVCSLELSRDCPKGQCVIGAIQNYTMQLQSNKNREEALKFLVHFIGDVHQPLHLCSLYKGGNGYLVKFDNQTRYKGWNGHSMPLNLHALWDDVMVEKVLKEIGSFDKMVQAIISLINSSPKEQWTECMDPIARLELLMNDISSGSSGSSNNLNEIGVCPLEWSKFSNKINCERIWVGVDSTKIDLGLEYYARNKDILMLQLAKAAYRTRFILDQLFYPSSNSL